jgi:hypothetical protein
MNWLKELGSAANAEAVLQLLNDYIGSLPRGRDIPPAYRPLVVRRAEDVHRWHRLLTVGVGTTDAPSPAFNDLCVVFMRASARLYELAPDSRPANGSADDAIGSN